MKVGLLTRPQLAFAIVGGLLLTTALAGCGGSSGNQSITPPQGLPQSIVSAWRGPVTGDTPAAFSTSSMFLVIKADGTIAGSFTVAGSQPGVVTGTAGVNPVAGLPPIVSLTLTQSGKYLETLSGPLQVTTNVTIPPAPDTLNGVLKGTTNGSDVGTGTFNLERTQ